MRRYRRTLLIDRIISFLAAFVGLVALAGAVIVQFNVAAQNQQLSEEMARLRLSLELLTQRTEELAAVADDGTVEGLLALQGRMDALEEEWAALPEQPASTGDTAAAAAGPDEDNAARTIDPAWPTEDCIPTGTRFMAMVGDRFPICRTPAVVSVSAITGDTVLVEGAGTIVETGFGALAGTSCTLMVFSADAEGFAEMRVTCQ